MTTKLQVTCPKCGSELIKSVIERTDQKVINPKKSDTFISCKESCYCINCGNIF